MIPSLAHGGKTSGPSALNRKLSVTDGPFAETKEVLAGSVLIDARDRDVIDAVAIPRPWPTTCPVCGVPLATRGGVLFQGADLVHAMCWRAATQAAPSRRRRLSARSRVEVDELVKTAIAGGGTHALPPMDCGFMYLWSFYDPDGHQWEVFWMDPTHVAQEGLR
jgi:hypothetical protein